VGLKRSVLQVGEVSYKINRVPKNLRSLPRVLRCFCQDRICNLETVLAVSAYSRLVNDLTDV